MRKSEYPKTPDTLGKKIRKKRMDLGLTLLEIAKQVGITESYLSRIEADKQIPTMFVTIKIAKILNEDLNNYLQTSAMKAQSLETWREMVNTLNVILPPSEKAALAKMLNGPKPNPKVSKNLQAKMNKKIN